MIKTLIQNILDQMTTSNGMLIALLDEHQNVVASNQKAMIHSTYDALTQQACRYMTTYSENNHLLRCVFQNEDTYYKIVINNDTDEAYRLLDVLSASFSTLLTHLYEKQDLTYLLTEYLKGNHGLLKDIEQLMHHDTRFKETFQVLYLDTIEPHPQLIHHLKWFLKDRHTHLLQQNQHTYVLIKEGDDETFSLDNLTEIIEPLHAFYHLGIGPVVHNLNDLIKSYTEAKQSVVIAEKFKLKMKIIDEESLKFHRFIYHMPLNYLSDMLTDQKYQLIQQLSDEDLTTIEEYFANNLSITETAKNLFIHRNTLIYRFDRIKGVTHLDVRQFEDAVLIYFLLLVKKHMA